MRTWTIVLASCAIAGAVLVIYGIVSLVQNGSVGLFTIPPGISLLLFSLLMGIIVKQRSPR
jgi:hypothetical protein